VILKIKTFSKRFFNFIHGKKIPKENCPQGGAIVRGGKLDQKVGDIKGFVMSFLYLNYSSLKL
jgi:hypothetical protein